MKQILFILVLTGLLGACSDGDFITINKEVITGVVQITNIPDEQKVLPTPSPTPTPSPSQTPIPNATPTPTPSTIPNIQGPGGEPTMPTPLPTPRITPTPNPTPMPQADGDEENDGKPHTGMGSGFIIAPNVIITNYHVIAGDKRHFQVNGYNDMKKYVAHLVAGDPKADIAILKIDDWDDFDNIIHPTILTWGHSSYLQQGEKVWAIGHPYGFSWSLSAGLISSLLRQDQDGTQYYMQTDTSINPGNSGGPLFNASGEVVGINSAIYGSRGFLGLTIPGDYAKKVINDLQHGGKIKESKIGISMKPSSDGHYILVDSILRTSNAIKAGLLPNDIINAIYNPDSNLKVEVKIPYQLQYQVRSLDPGTIITLYITRDHVEHKKITFALDGNDLLENVKVVPVATPSPTPTPTPSK